MKEFTFRGAIAALALLGIAVQSYAATGDNWIISGWPQIDGSTWLFDYNEGSAAATNPRPLNFSGNLASLMVSGLDFDSQGRLFAMTSSGFYEVNPLNGDLTLRGAFGIGIEGAAGYDAVNNRFLVAAGFGGIEEVNLTTFNHNLISTLNGLDDVSGVAVDGAGRIWICASNTNTSGLIELYELQGTTPVSYGSLGVAAAGAICDLDIDSAGNLTLVSGNDLYRVTPTFGSPTATLVSPFTNLQSVYGGIALNPVPEPGFALVGLLPFGLLIQRRSKSGRMKQ